MLESLRVHPGQAIRLDEISANGTEPPGMGKKEGTEALQQLNDQLCELQEKLYAQNKHKVLIVLQGMDTSGKDGVIRGVFRGVNPQGLKISNFKVPSALELAHDYLWRIHQRTPGSGEITIFNRSHYEDVLVVRVHELAPPERWQKRYEHISAFEKMLADEGTLILKFFLHIDADEQKARLISRRDTPNKQWKFNPGDLRDRQFWGEFLKAYEDALRLTSTDWAPWYVIPANRKWLRNFAIASILVEALQKLSLEYPPAPEGISSYEVI